MKRKALVAAVCILAMATLFTSSAMAAWYTCTITQVGSFQNNYLVNLTDTAASPAFTNCPYYILPGAQFANGMLATALTAYANGANVSVWIDSPAAYGVVWSIFALK